MAEGLKPRYLSQMAEKTGLEDADIIPGKDMTAKKPRKFSLLSMAKYVMAKLKELTFDELTTTDKTLPGAVNELNGRMETPLIKKQFFSGAAFLPSNGAGSLNMGALNIPEGYEYVGVLSCGNSYGDQFQVSYSRYGNEIYAMVKNYYAGEALTANISCNALFMKM